MNSDGLLLSIDCSNRWTCLGLAEKGAPVGECCLDLKRRQAGQLAPTVENFLKVLGYSLPQVTCLAVTTGPGYFTGIRIGMAYTMGLALALGVKVVPLSALDVLARSYVPPSVPTGLIALIAASRDSAFSAGWTAEGEKFLPEAERPWEEIWRIRQSMAGKAEIIAARDPRLFSGRAGLPIVFLPSPGGLAAASLAWANRENALDPCRLRAEYLKEPGIGNS